MLYSFILSHTLWTQHTNICILITLENKYTRLFFLKNLQTANIQSANSKYTIGNQQIYNLQTANIQLTISKYTICKQQIYNLQTANIQLAISKYTICKHTTYKYLTAFFASIFGIALRAGTEHQIVWDDTERSRYNIIQGLCVLCTFKLTTSNNNNDYVEFVLYIVFLLYTYIQQLV